MVASCFSFGNYHSTNACGDAGRAEYENFFALHGDYKTISSCPYCEAPIDCHWSGMLERDELLTLEPSLIWFDINWWEAYVVLCGRCGWHRYHRVECEDGVPQALHWAATFSKVDFSSPNAPLSELRRHLLSGSAAFRDLSPQQAEDIVANIFKEHLDCEIYYTSNGVYSKDGGIDFVLVRTRDGIDTAFQVKRRRRLGAEPITTVREFLGAVALSPYKRAYFVTTAPRFTQATAQILSATEALRQRSMECHLVDGNNLMQFLKSRSFPNPALGFFTSRSWLSEFHWQRIERDESGRFERSSGRLRSTTELLGEMGLK